MKIDHKLAAALGVLALVVPVGAAQADRGGKGKGATKTAQYNVKGTYAGDGVVSITKASGHARKAGWKGEDITFDLSSARIRVADTNDDGAQDLADVLPGDRVRVKARLPKRDPGAGPYVAQRLVDKTHPTGDSDSGGEDSGGSESEE